MSPGPYRTAELPTIAVVNERGTQHLPDNLPARAVPPRVEQPLLLKPRSFRNVTCGIGVTSASAQELAMYIILVEDDGRWAARSSARWSAKDTR